MNLNVSNDYTQKAGEPVAVSAGSSKVATEHHRSHRAEGGAYCVEMNQTKRSQNAYADHGKTKEEVMMDAQAKNVKTQKDYMTVMSHSMSGEDFAALSENGYEVEQMNPEEAVTIVDEMKATLAEAGVVINGYNDTMDADKLEEITGSPARAQAISKAFDERQVPMTEENVEEAVSVMDMTTKEQPLSDGSVKYLLENELFPTVDNLYLASHSGAANAKAQGQGYFAENTQGYYGKKAEATNPEELLDQIDRILKESGMEATKQNRSDALWMVENGIAVTAESMQLMSQIRQLHLPLTEEQAADVAARAISDGMDAKDAIPVEGETLLQQAVEIKENVEQITDQTVEVVVNSDVPLTLKQLTQASNAEGTDANKSTTATTATDTETKEANLIKARRMMEEIRLSMSVRANYHLLKQGFSIDTTELSKLVDALKEEEKHFLEIKYRGDSEQVNQEREEWFNKTQEAILAIPGLPVSILGNDLTGEDTLQAFVEAGTNLQAQLANAGERYETMMTEVRTDLGDSIKKAFRNVDDLLEDIGMESDDESRRAVRILGYNQMAITKEHVDAVKQAYARVHHVVEAMTPSATLDLIREGSNPLELTMEELEQRLNATQQTPEANVAKYSQFLVDLEENHSITEEEKESYLGIYRMLHQIEKQDGAAVGSLMAQGAEINLKNLLSAVRSRKHAGMDVSVDDTVGELTEQVQMGNSITEQIMSAFSTKESVERQDKELTENVRACAKISEETVAFAVENHITPTLEHLVATDTLRNRRGDMADKAKKAQERLHSMENSDMTGLEELADQLELCKDQVIEQFTDEGSAKKAYQEMAQVMEQVFEEAAIGSDRGIDIREMSLAMKQLHVAGSLVREENYEIPIQIGEEATSVNVKIIHDKNSAGRVSITMENETFGKLGAMFEDKDGQLSGYVVSSSEDGLSKASQTKERMIEALSEHEIELNDINYIYSETLSINNFAGNTDDNSNSISTKNLYETAKTFLQVIGEASLFH